ncbi:SLOG family protein, partial [Enterococcus gallinarum]
MNLAEKQSANWNEANQLWASEVLEKADYHAFITKRPYESPA